MIAVVAYAVVLALVVLFVDESMMLVSDKKRSVGGSGLASRFATALLGVHEDRIVLKGGWTS